MAPRAAPTPVHCPVSQGGFDIVRTGVNRTVKPRKRKRLLWRAVFWTAAAVVAIHLSLATGLFLLRYMNPITTGVQMQRRAESWFKKETYRKRSTFVALNRISIQLQHAVISAEDGRFYRHHGIDWAETEKVLEEGLEDGEAPRGASTITQQLVKNLFFTTHRNPVRKAVEYTAAPMADFILGKRRVLELYLNVAEWGPAYGAPRKPRNIITRPPRNAWTAIRPRGWPRACRRRCAAAPRS